MKKTGRILVCLLLACGMLALVSCGGGSRETVSATDTETVSVTDTESATVTESATESATEEATEPEMPDGAVCYVGEGEDTVYAYFFSVAEAIEAYPAGAEIHLIEDDGVPCEIPAGFDGSVYFNACTVNLTAETGAFVDYPFVNRTTDRFYLSNPHDVATGEAWIPCEGLHGLNVWVLSDPEGILTPGGYKYWNVNAGDNMLAPEYEFRYCYELSHMDDGYVGEADGVFYLTFQEAIDNVLPANLEKPHIVGDTIPEEQAVPPIPGTEYIQSSYSWNIYFGSFPFGITWDDVDWATDGEGHWYCYFNDIVKFAEGSNTWQKYAYIWSDAEGFRPGLYSMPLVDEPIDEERYDENGLMVEFEIGWYHFTWLSDMLYLDVVDELHDYAHLDSAVGDSGETEHLLVVERDFYDIPAGTYRITDVDVNNYGNRQFDGEGNLVATDIIIYRIERVA